MSDKFDASKEAVKIENMAKTVMDTDTFSNRESSQSLAKEWQSLSATQRTEVGKELSKQFDNSSWNSLPRPKLEFDTKGECTAIDFNASAFDFKNETSDLRVAAIKPSTGGELVEVSHKESGSKTADWLDSVVFDNASTEKNTTKKSLLAAGGVPWDFTPHGPGANAGDMAPAAMDSEPPKNTQKQAQSQTAVHGF